LEDILPVDMVDFKILRKDRYFFDWIMEKNQEVYKLLINVSKENKGFEKNRIE
jgi:hypothetical protein